MVPTYDTVTTDSWTTGAETSRTKAHTCTAAANLLIVFAFGESSTWVYTGVTYNGVAMTKSYTTGNVVLECWTLANPGTGSSYNVVASYNSGSNVKRGLVICSFTGATLDTSGTQTFASGGSSSVTVSTATDNELLIDCACTYRDAGWAALSPGASQTEIADFASTKYGMASSYKSAASAGNNTTSWSGGVDYIGQITVALKEPVSGPANVKTVNGLAKASDKTINGLAIESVKTYNGLA